MLKYDDYIKKRVAIETQKNLLKNKISELNKHKLQLKIEMFIKQNREIHK